MRFAPVAHAVENFLWLADGIDWAFRKNVQVFVCDNGGDFENLVDFRAEARHFHVDPDEIGGVLHKIDNEGIKGIKGIKEEVTG